MPVARCYVIDATAVGQEGKSSQENEARQGPGYVLQAFRPVQFQFHIADHKRDSRVGPEIEGEVVVEELFRSSGFRKQAEAGDGGEGEVLDVIEVHQIAGGYRIGSSERLDVGEDEKVQEHGGEQCLCSVEPEEAFQSGIFVRPGDGEQDGDSVNEEKEVGGEGGFVMGGGEGVHGGLDLSDDGKKETHGQEGP